VPHDSTQPATTSILIGGSVVACPVRGTPIAGLVPVPGTAAVILGYTDLGRAVVVATTSLAWLDDLEEAVREARAKAIVEAGMTPAAVL